MRASPGKVPVRGAFATSAAELLSGVYGARPVNEEREGANISLVKGPQPMRAFGLGDGLATKAGNLHDPWKYVVSPIGPSDLDPHAHRLQTALSAERHEEVIIQGRFQSTVG